MPTTRRRFLKAQNSEVALHQLPDEVLSDVFQLSVLSHDWDNMNIVRHLSTISSVCSRWRHAALGCPVLWSSILYNQRTTLIKRHAQNRVKAYIQRSRMASISVFFYMAPSDLYDSKDITFFNKVISPHISRCRVLNLVVNTDAHLHSILPFQGLLGSSLSFRCIVVYPDIPYGMSASSDLPLPLLRENNNTLLRSLTLYLQPTLDLEHVNASHMRTISIKGYSTMWADTLKLISRSSSTLQNLTIDFADPPPSTVYSSGQLLIGDASSKILLHHLNRLSCAANSLCTGLAGTMDMSNLTYVHLTDFDFLVESWDEAHDEDGTVISPPPIRPLLGHIPRLQSLCISLSNSCDVEQIIVELFIDYSSIMLLEIDGWEDHSVKQMLQMLAAEPENWGKIANNQPFHERYAPRNAPYPSTPLLPALRVMRFTQGYRRLPMIALEVAIANALTHRPAIRIERNEAVTDGPNFEPNEMRMILEEVEEDNNIIEPRWI